MTTTESYPPQPDHLTAWCVRPVASGPHAHTVAHGANLAAVSDDRVKGGFARRSPILLAVLGLGVSLGYFDISLFLSSDLVGRILLCLITWFVLSLPFAVFVGRFIAFGNQSDMLADEQSLDHFVKSA